MSRCKGCGAEIKFVKTEKGKWLPVNPSPLKVATIVNTDEQGHDKYGIKTGYIPHWATCPEAKKFRKTKE